MGFPPWPPLAAPLAALVVRDLPFGFISSAMTDIDTQTLPKADPPQAASAPDTPAPDTLARSANPVLVEATRGAMVESRHRGAFAVVDVEGRVIASAGDTERPIYARSAIKPLQAIPLVETGAAEAFGLGHGEIALACASHRGEPRHVETVTAWLARIGCSVADLECGTHLPSSPKALAELLGARGTPNAAHNNCSGKHSGFLIALIDVFGYVGSMVFTFFGGSIARDFGWPVFLTVLLTITVLALVTVTAFLYMGYRAANRSRT